MTKQTENLRRRYIYELDRVFDAVHALEQLALDPPPPRDELQRESESAFYDAASAVGGNFFSHWYRPELLARFLEERRSPNPDKDWLADNFYMMASDAGLETNNGVALIFFGVDWNGATEKGKREFGVTETPCKHPSSSGLL